MEQNVQTPDLAKILQALVINQKTLAIAIGIDLPMTINLPAATMQNEQTSTKVMLPESLMSRILYPNVFHRAVERGLISQGEDGKLVWIHHNRTLLAYLLGRLFCGDKAKVVCNGMNPVWIQGDFHFPDNELTMLFGYSVRKMRSNRKMMNLPKNFQLIDNLFVK